MAPTLFRASLFVALSLCSTAFAQEMPKDFDAYVERTMKAFQVPGLSIAVV